MSGKTFSGRLSWRIIGIVSVISIIAQIAVYFTFRWLQDTPVMHVVMLVIGLASLAAIFFACRAVINYMTRPVSELSKAVLKMANGNLKAVLPEIKSEDEMRRLHDSFQTMQSSLLEYIEELKTTTAANERIQSDIELARKGASQQEKDIVDSLYDSVQAFVEDNPQNDDLTIVSLKLGVES